MRNNKYIGVLLCFISFSVWATPDIQSWTTSQGAKVMFVHAPELPMLDMRVVFDAGSARDGDLSGVARMTNSVVAASGGAWDADALAQRLESVGAELGSGSLKDMAFISMRSLTDKAILDTSVQTLNAILTSPNFNQSDVKRVRQGMLAGLIRAEQSPSAIGKKRMMQGVFGTHPYASSSAGTKATVSALTADQLKYYFQQYYVAKNALLVIVGAVDRAQAETIAESVMDKVPAGDKAAALSAVKVLAQGKQEHIEFPSTQSHVFIAQTGMKRGDDDYFVLYVGNHILGGSGLVSLLSDEVREKRGLAYSAYSYFSPMRYEGPFLMAAQTKNSQAEETVAIIKETLQLFIDNGPTDAQLLASKQNITGSFPLKIASNSKIVSYLAMIGFYDLPLSYLDDFVGRIEAITIEQIKETFNRRVHPDQMFTLTVGAKSKVLPKAE